MDALLGKITQHAVNYAIRTGITITSGFAIQQASRLMKTVKGSRKDEIATLQYKLKNKIQIISPTIDLIELIAARGNTSLESAVTLTKQIRVGIQDLGMRLSRATTDETLLRKGSSKAKSRDQMDLEIQLIIVDMKKLLDQIEDAVPLINLAITTSGISLDTTLPATVSPSRLLQASTFLTSGDTSYTANPSDAVQIGPAFVLSIYMLFAAHAYRPHDQEGVRETTWQEVVHKARVKLMRVSLDELYDVPSCKEDFLQNPINGDSKLEDGLPQRIPSQGKAFEFAYQLLIIEDFDDDRVHEDEEQGPYDEVARAGIREAIPIHQISKIFYADTGKILNIGGDGESNNPILLLRRDVNAVPPRRMIERPSPGYEEEDEDDGTDDEFKSPHPNMRDKEDSPGAQIRRESFGPISPELKAQQAQATSRKWKFPPNLDPEWMAFEVYNEAPDSDDDDDVETSLAEESSPPLYPDPTAISSAFSRLNIYSSPVQSPVSQQEKLNSSELTRNAAIREPSTSIPEYNAVPMPALRTSLSLLEVLIRLTALQQFQQSSHLTITDELLNFFLSESSTTGAGADTDYRKRTRRDARRRVGFDPYDESPIKRRGEEYIDRYASQDREQHWDEPYNYEERKRRPGAFDGEWRYGAGGGTPRSARDSPGLQSPPLESPDLVSSPSPSVRRAMQDRTRSLPSLSGLRQPTFDGSKRREDTVRREMGLLGQSPLGRNESDSTLGTSPRTADGEETQ